MKNPYKLLIFFVLSVVILQGCNDQDDTLNVPSDLVVQNFIWKGLNLYYLWQADVPDLADNRFKNQNELNDFLRTKDSPEALFQDLLNKPISKFPVGVAVDRFSVLVDDYTYLENLFQGVTKNNGVDFALFRQTTTSTEVYGYVRYIIPNSDAASKDIHRGDIFYAVNGTPLNIDNYVSLLSSDSYTLNLATYNGTTVTPNGKSVILTKAELTENPVLQTQIITVGTHKVGYLVYNAFTANFEPQLNAAFGELKTGGATDLVLDLRYNGGGSVATAARLASMITGQFKGQLFAREQWNAKVQAYYEANNPGSLVNNFTDKLENGSAINSLNLTKVYILTTKSTASASELVINGLKPYVTVVQIGDTTIGKNAASITLYDSPTFGKKGRSTQHKYAMQPLVIKTANKDGFGDYQNGLAPTTPLKEKLSDLGQLGDPSELLLSAALGQINGTNRMAKPNNDKEFQQLRDSKSLLPFGSEMYIETPSDLNIVLKSL